MSSTRRRLLATVGTGALAVTAGCTAALARVRGCPRPAESLEYEYRVEGDADTLGSGYRPALALFTNAEEASERRSTELSNAGNKFVVRTDFDEQCLLVAQVIGSGSSSGLHVTGVETIDDGLRSYSCVTRPSRHDDAFLYTFLIRVDPGDDDQIVAEHVHRGGNSDHDLRTDR
ncbi:hypothetical protein [Natronorarus salvus]|uniref:hypothetical protein n=1 Tax=Natronorarus salvus TaxID=3117733 RepID=UPI002F263BC9